jgi:ligand-binding SRPBCC domain-containing protein
MYYELTDRFVVKSDAAATWAFFSTAENLPAITPPWLGFTIRSAGGPIKIERETLLDYTIKWLGVPMRWRTRIIEWDPPRSFVDLQVRGPYVLWHHQHRFEAVAEGTECSDRVIYKLPGGWLARPAHALVVRRQLMGIFRFRRKVIGERLGWVREVQEDVRIGRLE